MPSVPLNLKAIAVKKKKNPLLSYIKLKQEVNNNDSVMYCTSKFLIYIFIFVSMTNEHRHDIDEQPPQVGTERGKTFFGSQF